MRRSGGTGLWLPVVLPVVLLAVMLAGCGAPSDGRYVGRIVGEPPTPCPDSPAVLLLRGTEARFLPNDGVTVLDGTISADGTVAAAAQADGIRRDGAGATGTAGKAGSGAGGAPRAPFRMVFQGRLDGTRVTGTFGTPRCRGRVELAPG